MNVSTMYQQGLSCQIQEGLSLYYNIVAGNGRLDPKCKETNVKRQENQCKIQGEYNSTPHTNEWLITQSLSASQATKAKGRELGDAQVCQQLMEHHQSLPQCA